MKGEKSKGRIKRNPKDALEELVATFRNKEWLNQTLRIHHQGRKYRIYCSEKEFLAYRINENCGVTPGFPGWLVCVVTHDHIMDESNLCACPSSEPTLRDWVRCIAEGDFEVI